MDPTTFGRLVELQKRVLQRLGSLSPADRNKLLDLVRNGDPTVDEAIAAIKAPEKLKAEQSRRITRKAPSDEDSLSF
jgi:hypothetical protein